MPMSHSENIKWFKIPHESFSGPLWGSTKPVQPPPPPAQT
ncbi:hypothetical protein PVAP13_8KG022280 [Panicum virgatum]|uniref:Uncharacterized protein n=1 Tax=Panicum virgatum TaxID=38727 RepID=A0A8T0PHJ2_PANVG|nr:hypothetical protein PVAP13_8KG022280 [Panicum virgatum]